jgi:hypothetical protein
VVFESELPEALVAALETFPNRGDCKEASSARPVYIVLAANHAGHPSPEHRIRGKQLRIASADFTIEADGERGRANCAFGIDAIGTELFREMVQMAALFLAAQKDRTPVHASAIMIGDHAVVLAGRSGSGKSTLALAADMMGLPVLAEDTVFVQLQAEFRIWGLCDHIHVCEEDSPRGTELRKRLRAGRLKSAVPVRQRQQSANSTALCVIARGDQAHLDPLASETAVHLLTSHAESGYDFYGRRMDDAIRAIARGGCWNLTLSRDPSDAIRLLVETFTDSAQGHSSDEARHA